MFSIGVGLLAAGAQQAIFSSAATTLGGEIARHAVAGALGFVSGTLGAVVAGASLKDALRAGATAGAIAFAVGALDAYGAKVEAQKIASEKAAMDVQKKMEIMAKKAEFRLLEENGLGKKTEAFAEGTFDDWITNGKYEDFSHWLSQNPFTPKKTYPQGYIKSMGFDSPFFGVGGTIKLFARGFPKSNFLKFKIKDYIRFGNTHIPPGVSGKAESVFTFAIKGGGKNMSFHYHIHKYNWYKPHTWFKYTPTPKKL